MRILIVLGICVASRLAPRIPLAPTLALSAAALIAVGSLRLALAADFLEARGNGSAVLARRLGRVFRDLSLLLSAAAIVYASTTL